METIADVKANPEFMCGLEMPEYDFNLYLIYQGKETLKYIAFYEGAKLFEGDDFKPSPFCIGDSLKCIVTCLSFLTVKPGDTGREHFASYTPKQLEWAESMTCGELCYYTSSFLDEKEGENHKTAKKFFAKRFSN